MRLHCQSDYPVRNPDDCPTVRQVRDGEWLARDADGRSARGSTPAAAIATLRK
ncbi:hypothetical protein [Haladaptatus halobius]|uniref:hypothetical protein n=1 Tax=Haladaptatus halobius TaxID=2884875 RepID=UPI001D0B2427|nr:hypothetical protein [Haladaptatus halobius]